MNPHHPKPGHSWLESIKKWLAPPVFPGEEEETRRAHLLNTVLLWLVSLLTLMAPILWLNPHLPKTVVASDVLVAFLLLGLRRFLRRNRTNLAGIVMLVLMILWLSYVIFQQGTIRTPVAGSYLFAVIIAGALFGWTGIISTVTASSLAVLGLIVAENAGLLPRPDYTVTLSQWLTYTSLFALSGGLSYYTNRLTQEALKRAHQGLFERDRAEEELRKSQAHFSTIFHTSPIGIAILRPDSVFIDANESLCQLFGYTRAELIGQTAASLNLFSQPGLPAEVYRELRANGRLHDFETQIHQKSGAIRDVVINMERIELSGEPHVLGLMVDITARKQAEQAEREQRVLAEALQNSAAALNSTLKFNEVLDRILDNVGQVVPHDSASVFLLDETRQYAEVVGYRDLRPQPYDRKGTRFTLAKTRSLREMYEKDAPIAIDDTQTFGGWVQVEVQSLTRSGLGAPVRVKGQIIGFLWLSSMKPRSFQALHAGRLQAFANYAGIAIENARLYEKVQKLALTDALTGIYNRTYFEAELARLEHCREYPISIIIADLDNMKTTNDQWGHIAGDELLRNTVRLLQSIFRTADILARIGGDEFAMLLPRTNAGTAQQIIARIEERLAEHNQQHPNLAILLSLGAASAEPGQLMDAFIQADRRMYANKWVRKAGKASTDMMER